MSSHYEVLKGKTVVHVTTSHIHDDVRIFHREARLLAPICREVVIMAPKAPEAVVDGVRMVSLSDAIPITRRERVRAAKAVSAKLSGMKADILHFHDPELLLSVPDHAARAGIPCVYDVHEDYRATLSENKGGGLKGALLSMSYAFYESMKAVKISGFVTVTPQISGIYAKYRKPVAMVRNFPDTERIISLVPGKRDGVDPSGMVYSGSLEQKSLFPLAEAVKRMSGDYPGISVTLVGTFRDESVKARIAEHWRAAGVADRIRMLDRLERDEFLKSLAGYSVGLVLFWPMKNVQVALPNKLFEYMAAGLPVIVPDCPNQRQVVEEARCGLYCDTTSSVEIEKAIRRLLGDPEEALAMGRRGREACVTKFNMQTDFGKLLELYGKLLGAQ